MLLTHSIRFATQYAWRMAFAMDEIPFSIPLPKKGNMRQSSNYITICIEMALRLHLIICNRQVCYSA